MLLLAQPQTDSTSGSAEAVPMERRRGLRIRQSRPIKVLDPRTSRFYAGQTQDISSTGLRVELPASMPVRAGCTVNIHVGLGQNGQPLANRRAMIPAKIVWVVRREEAGQTVMTAGVEFVAHIAARLDAA